MKGVLIDDHGQENVVWPTNHKFVCSPRYNQIFSAEIFGEFLIQYTFVQDGPCFRLQSVDGHVAEPADFVYEELIFGLFFYMGHNMNGRFRLKSVWGLKAMLTFTLVPNLFWNDLQKLDVNCAP